MQPSAIIDASSGLGKDYVDYVLNYACKRGAGLSMDTVGPTPWRQKSSLSQLYVGSQRGVPGKKKKKKEKALHRLLRYSRSPLTYPTYSSV